MLFSQNAWKAEHIASIVNTNTYSETNSLLRGPDAYHGVVGSFTTTRFGFIRISSKITERGSQIKLQLNNGDQVLLGGTGWDGGTLTNDVVYLLPAGTYSIQLYMDADNEFGSTVTRQEYDINALYTDADNTALDEFLKVKF